jgi:hypothetical protein
MTDAIKSACKFLGMAACLCLLIGFGLCGAGGVIVGLCSLSWQYGWMYFVVGVAGLLIAAMFWKIFRILSK